MPGLFEMVPSPQAADLILFARARALSLPPFPMAGRAPRLRAMTPGPLPAPPQTQLLKRLGDKGALTTKWGQRGEGEEGQGGWKGHSTEAEHVFSMKMMPRPLLSSSQENAVI